MEKAAAAIGLGWSPEDADRSTRAQPESESLKRLSSRLRETSGSAASTEVKSVGGASGGDRQMLWVDGVGGYQVCLADRIVLGQPAGAGGDPRDRPDVAILGDLSRRHATIQRQSGGYVLTPHAATTIEGRELDAPTALTDGVLIGLGDSVLVRFRLPHALSATARLELESRHRTVPGADAVLLMAESCVLGPKPHSHVWCRRWRGEAILFRGSGGLLCRAEGGLARGGERHTDPIAIRSGQRVEGQDFTLSVESLDES